MHHRSKLRWRPPIAESLLLAAVALACIHCDKQQTSQRAESRAPSQSRPLKRSCSSDPSPQVPAIANCGLASTSGDPLIDDFEQGDVGWYLFTDQSAGCIELRLAAEQSSVLHARGEGFSGWGAAFGRSFQWDARQSKNCLYDASTYSGVRFRARGSASLRLVLGTKTSTFQSLGGSCPDGDGCYDQYGRTLALTSAWQTFEVDFCSVAQEGWGTPFEAFLPDELVHLNFMVKSSLPFDVWVDDLEFVPRS